MFMIFFLGVLIDFSRILKDTSKGLMDLAAGYGFHQENMLSLDRSNSLWRLNTGLELPISGLLLMGVDANFTGWILTLPILDAQKLNS